jgi:hypothetical protein
MNLIELEKENTCPVLGVTTYSKFRRPPADATRIHGDCNLI